MTRLRYMLAKIVFGITPPCDDMTVLLSKSIDTPPTLKERMQTELHLSLCVACSRVRTQFDVLHGVARQILDEDVSGTSAKPQMRSMMLKSTAITLPEDVKGRLQNRINEELNNSDSKPGL